MWTYWYTSMVEHQLHCYKLRSLQSAVYLALILNASTGFSVSQITPEPEPQADVVCLLQRWDLLDSLANAKQPRQQDTKMNSCCWNLRQEVQAVWRVYCTISGSDTDLVQDSIAQRSTGVSETWVSGWRQCFVSVAAAGFGEQLTINSIAQTVTLASQQWAKGYSLGGIFAAVAGFGSQRSQYLSPVKDHYRQIKCSFWESLSKLLSS